MAKPQAPPDFALEKGLPVNLDAERYVLGSILMDDSLYVEVASAITSQEFSLEKHRRIFMRMGELYERGERIDRVTLANELMKNAQLESVDGLGYLVSLDEGLPALANFQSYVQIVKDKAALRHIIFTSQKLIDRCLVGDEEPQELAQSAVASLVNLTEKKSDRGPERAFETITNYPGGLNGFFDTTVRNSLGLKTGFTKFDEMTGGLQKQELIIIGARPSQGKAQPLDSHVLTESGEWREMGKMKTGDRVASVDGQESIVEGVYPQGTRKVFRVTFSDGRSTRCCGDHLWSVWHRKWKERRVLSTDAVARLLIEPQHKYRLAIDQCSGDFGSDTEEYQVAPWLLGYLLGNGGFREGTPRVTTGDQHMVERVSLEVATMKLHLVPEFPGSIDYRIVQNEGARRLGCSGGFPNPLTSALKNLGLHGLLSHQKFIPTKYQTASRATRLEIVRGLLDSDGTVEKSGNVRFSSSSKAMAYELCMMARSLGYISTFGERATPHYRYKGELREGRPSFVVAILGLDRTELLTNPRKAKRIVPRVTRESRLTFAAIEPDGETETQCIKVSHPSSLYLTDDYICTHNTALALNIASFIAMKGDNKSVGVFSLEMTKESLLTRLICCEARVDQQKFRAGYLNQDERRRLTAIASKLESVKLFIDDRKSRTILDIHTAARKLKEKEGLHLVVIDYLQLMLMHVKTDNRAQAVGAITHYIKNTMVEDLDVPVVLLSQLNRDPDKRKGDHRPELSDLKESGDIEQDADLVAFIFREEMYNRDREDLRGLAELIIKKQRNGPVGTINLVFLKEFTKFENRVSDFGAGELLDDPRAGS